MTISRTNFWNDTEFSVVKCWVGARGICFAYGPLVLTEHDNFMYGSGLQTYTRETPNNGFPNYIVYRAVDPTQIIICLAGASKFSQVIEYYLNSDSVSSTLFPGAANAFIKDLYLARRTVLLAQLGISPNPGNIPKKITIVGHSLGAALGLIMAADLKTNFAATAEIKSVICLGAPRVANETFAQFMNAAPVYTVGHNDDPIPSLPPQRLNISFQSVFAGQTNNRVRAINLTHCGTFHRLDRSGCALADAGPQLSYEEALAQSWSFFGSNPIEDHNIERYRDGFSNLINNDPSLLARYQSNQNDKIGDWGADAECPDQPPQVAAPIAQLPPLTSLIPLAAPAAGETQVRNLTGVGLRPIVRTVYNNQRPMTRRHLDGDGFTVKKSLEIIREINRLRSHDAGVMTGGTKGSPLVFDPEVIDQETVDAFDTVEQYLRKTFKK